MRVILGPMEGVIDALMRELLTEINDYDLCVTEFIRIVDQRLPTRVFKRFCPELDHHCLTPSGTPVRIQLLGQDPIWMAENAVKALELGSHGIDLNFGCPAKTVNKNRGGAALLKDPEAIYNVIHSAREAIGKEATLSAKVRLGWDDPADAEEIYDAVANAGASEIVVHARTKEDGYKAEKIKWERLGELNKNQRLPLIANGEIWNYQDGQKCQQMTNSEDLMICRGALATPNLGNVVKNNQPPMSWSELLELLDKYSQYELAGYKSLYFPNRLKQWLSYLKRSYPEAHTLFSDIRRLTTQEAILPILQQHREKNSDI
ncbi:tRNA dihydrouridine(16) synthase DusC [Vibrio sp. SS-MA-C1-2]|uniref:tRNA dihydrouridine(16) synthase DusC n=1 Tax=Vibrio sp. SS-MA-C1-2 TaxID=2908646 RepID=UPI001F21B8D4|nr:tRNA dihydrouridine(16) synthase DusC [Vibrio sp. SS-MA-C1-2]UJF19843.1 tRNA dihydrouridine(16) synthase DusC [Vibrio sp. SS-MA-C1-2]